MLDALVGFQKYIVIGLCAALLGVSSVAYLYRANYLTASAQRDQAIQDAKSAEAALKSYQAQSQATIDALQRAQVTSRQIGAQNRRTREKILTAPTNEDAPVAPILRDTINGLRR
jgi:hypothetical protein